MTRVLLTFGDERLGPTLRRFLRQAHAMRSYDRIVCASPRDLDAGFRRRFREVLRSEVRGFGYFCWKPQLIHEVLDSLAPGDVLHYCDVGCHLNPGGRSRLQEYFALVEQSASGVLAFQATPLPTSFGPLAGSTPFPDWINGAWCKGDALAYFGLEHDAEFLDAPMTIATTGFFRMVPASQSLVRDWRCAFMHDFALIDDTASRRANQPGFQEHRHDQSLFSCLAHLHRVETVSNAEIELPRSALGRGDWSCLKRHPIHAKRDKQLSLVARIRSEVARRGPRLKVWSNVR